MVASRQVLKAATGSLATMPAKMMSEMPLPMPRSVICSPSHMRKQVPVVMVIMATMRNPQPGVITTDCPATLICSTPNDMK